MSATLSFPVFDFPGFVTAYDQARKARGLGWYEFADQLWDQSKDLNESLDDHRMCGGALSRQADRGQTSCQYALFMLRFLHEPPETYLNGPGTHSGDTTLPDAGPGERLRWDLPELHAALNAQRQAQGLSWAELAAELDCTPARLTNLKTAKQTDLELAMCVTQWLQRPAADFIHPANW